MSGVRRGVSVQNIVWRRDGTVATRSPRGLEYEHRPDCTVRKNHRCSCWVGLVTRGDETPTRLARDIRAGIIGGVAALVFVIALTATLYFAGAAQ